jgi:hypothetical protein
LAQGGATGLAGVHQHDESIILPLDVVVVVVVVWIVTSLVLEGSSSWDRSNIGSHSLDAMVVLVVTISTLELDGRLFLYYYCSDIVWFFFVCSSTEDDNI